MRIGFTLDTNFGDYGQPMPDSRDVASTIELMINEGVLAEKAGFHSIQVPDRHGRTENYLPSPWQVLTILARETHRVAIGAYALVNTLYHPMFIAEQCATLDNLSRGRLYMTWARGYHPGYWSLMGIPRERMLGRFLENVRIIEQAYQGERFSFHGDFYDVDDALISPQPFQSPHFPFWGGGQLPAAIERCASYSDAWTCDDFPIDPPTWKRQANAYRDAAIERGKKPFIVLMRNAWVADTREKAITEFGSHFVDEMRFYAAQGILAHHPDLDSPEKITAESAIDHNVVGSAQQCIERLEYYEEDLGVDYVTVRFRMVTGPSLAKTRDQILRFGDEVVSYFHKKDPTPPTHPAIPSGARW